MTDLIRIPAGAPVTILANDAGVKAGTQGHFRGTHPDSGNLLVDVEDRGRVAFLAHQISHPALNGRDRSAVHQEEPKRTYRASGVIKVGGKEITLYINHLDLARAMGIGGTALTSIAAASGVKPLSHGAMVRYTAPDIYAIHELMEAMAEFEVSAKVAVKILAKIAAKEKAS